MASFQFSEEEYIAAALGSTRKAFKRTYILLPIAFTLLAFSIFFREFGWVAVLFGAAGGVLFSIFYHFFMRRMMRKNFHEQALLREAFHLKITETGIEYSHDSGNYFYKWEHTRHWSEDSRFIYLFETRIVIRIIPKRVLSTEEESLIRSKLGTVPRK